MVALVPTSEGLLPFVMIVITVTVALYGWFPSQLFLPL
jgi:hypothetical protein